MIFETKIQDIICQCEVLDYTPAKPLEITGPGMADAYPPEPAEFTYHLINDSGEYLKNLTSSVSDDEEEMLFNQYLKLIE